MSFIVNAVNFRLGYTKYWNNIWCLSGKLNYSFLTNLDNNIIEYIYSILEMYWLKLLGFMISNIKIIRVNVKTYILIYIRFQAMEVQELFLKKTSMFENYYISKDLKLFFFEIGYFSENFQLRKFKFLLGFLKEYAVFLSGKYRYQIIRKGYFKILKTLLLYLIFECSYLRTYNIFSESEYFKEIGWRSDLVFYIVYLYIYRWYLQWLYPFLISKLRKFFKLDHNFQIYTMAVPLIDISAFFLGKYIQLKLMQKYPVKRIVKGLLDKFSKEYLKNDFKGIKICISGRFSRADRKLFYWKSQGKLGYNHTGMNLDYFSGTIILSNSICGIKVWLNQTIKTKAYFIY